MTHILREEPDASLFAIPADYKVVERVPPANQNPRTGELRVGPAGTLGSAEANPAKP